jgi:hypothetical protein
MPNYKDTRKESAAGYTKQSEVSPALTALIGLTEKEAQWQHVLNLWAFEHALD